LLKKNANPNFSKAGTAANANAPRIATSVQSTRSAKNIVARSNSQSCHGGALGIVGGGVTLRLASESIEAVMAGGIGAVAVDIITL
jgi:hypothetical protein